MPGESTFHCKLQTIQSECISNISSFQLLTCRSQIAVLHQSEHWLSDGTFDARPLDIQPHFSQLYMIFGLIGDECKVCCMVLTPDRTIATYIQLFTVLRNLLLQNFQTVGALQFLHTDQEQAPMTSARNVFGPNLRIRTCGFHFAKNVLGRLNALHLQPVYRRDPALGYDQPPYSELYTYVRRLIAIMVLPAHLVSHAFQTNFANPPNMNDDNIRHFVQYFTNQWLNFEENIQSWNHFDHSGPRTTNFCEAFNGSLQSKFQVSLFESVYSSETLSF